MGRYDYPGYEEEQNQQGDDSMVVTDCNGNQLLSGDAVHLTQDLKVKGSSMTIKKGTVVKNIRLTDNPEEVDCKVNGSSIVLKTCYLKKKK